MWKTFVAPGVDMDEAWPTPNVCAVGHVIWEGESILGSERGRAYLAGRADRRYGDERDSVGVGGRARAGAR